MKKLIFVLSLCICFSACSSAYKVKSESQPAPDLKKYATIFIGWIDFGGDNWKELGYKGRDGWVSCFHELNVNWLQADLKERMSDKKLLFGSVTNNNPAGDLAVLFRNVRVTKSGIDDDYITMDVDFVALPGKEAPVYSKPYRVRERIRPPDVPVRGAARVRHEKPRFIYRKKAGLTEKFHMRHRRAPRRRPDDNTQIAADYFTLTTENTPKWSDGCTPSYRPLQHRDEAMTLPREKVRFNRIKSMRALRASFSELR